MTTVAHKASHHTTPRSRRRRAAVIAAIAWLLLAQTLFTVHRIDHVEHGVACALCMEADHAGGPIHEPIHAIAAPEPAAVEPTVRESAPVLFIPSYYSRGPPKHLEA
jgi:hypothetical protein